MEFSRKAGEFMDNFEKLILIGEILTGSAYRTIIIMVHVFNLFISFMGRMGSLLVIVC